MVEPIKNANILLEYKEMLREQYFSRNDCCEVDSSLDFNRVLAKHTRCIPEHLRCVTTNVTCNECDK